MREAAAYNGRWGCGYERTWNFAGGFSVAASFRVRTAILREMAFSVPV